MITPEFRVGFPNLLEAKGSQLYPDSVSYNLVMIFDESTDLTELEEMIEQAIQSKFPGGKGRPAYIPSPIREGKPVSKSNPDGYDLCKYPQYKDKFVIRASRSVSQGAPGVVDAQLKPIIDPKDIYSGMYGRARIEAYWNKNQKRVSLGLVNFQKTRDGERIGRATPKPEDDFGVFVAPETDSKGGDNAELLGV